MKRWGRRIRASIGMGLIWGAAWFGAGLVLARVPGFHSDLPFALLFAPLGFVTGIIFSGILVGIEGRLASRTLDTNDGEPRRVIEIVADRLRFLNPVRVGSRIRAVGEIISAEEVKGAIQSIVRVTVEIEGEEKPACALMARCGSAAIMSPFPFPCCSTSMARTSGSR